MKNVILKFVIGFTAALSLLYADACGDECNGDPTNIQMGIINSMAHSNRLYKPNDNEPHANLYRSQAICYESSRLYHREKKLHNQERYEEVEVAIFSEFPSETLTNYYQKAYLIMPFDLQRAYAYCILQADTVNTMFDEITHGDPEVVDHLFRFYYLAKDDIKAKYPDFEEMKTKIFRFLLHIERPCPICNSEN